MTCKLWNILANYFLIRSLPLDYWLSAITRSLCSFVSIDFVLNNTMLVVMNIVNVTRQHLINRASLFDQYRTHVLIILPYYEAWTNLPRLSKSIILNYWQFSLLPYHVLGRWLSKLRATRPWYIAIHHQHTILALYSNNTIIVHISHLCE